MIDLSATTARAMELLSEKGLSSKKLSSYTHTGFGCIVRHFHKKGIFCVTPVMLDQYLIEQRRLYEQEEISQWKWTMIRRGCELLKHCAVKDSVELPPLLPWIPELQRSRQSISKSTPTAEQFADPENIFALVWKTNRAMHELGLTDATLRHYRDEGLAVILNRHYAAMTERFSEDIIDRTVVEKRLEYERGQAARTSWHNLRKAAHWLREMYHTGSISFSKVPNWGQREPVEEFGLLLQKFYTDAETRDNLAETSRNVARSAVRRFLFEMEDHGYYFLSDFTPLIINACVTSFAGHYTGGLHSAIYSVRLFLRYLYEKGLTSSNLSESLPELISTRRMFHEGFSQEELKRLLAQPNRSTSVGKRDYAMMVLAVQSGLRACDIVRLELNSIDWRSRSIRLVQHKTGQPIILPLEVDSGNAIAEYILNGRPKTAVPYLFLCHAGPARPLKARSASGIVSRYMKQANIYAGRRAFHALRRTFGTRLLQNEIPVELIQQLLGHTDINSMKPYLSIDELGLKKCALPLPSHGKIGD